MEMGGSSRGDDDCCKPGAPARPVLLASLALFAKGRPKADSDDNSDIPATLGACKKGLRVANPVFELASDKGGGPRSLFVCQLHDFGLEWARMFGGRGL